MSECGMIDDWRDSKNLKKVNSSISRADGMPDFGTEIAQLRRYVEQQLLTQFQKHGYHLIEVPLVEQTDLYLRKSGEDIVTQMYDFVHQNRRLCLRPEMTASVIRAYIEHCPTLEPQKLCYAGAVFRYDLNLSYRQFTQVGVELIGMNSAIADAEVIYTACLSLDKLGIANYQVVMGHMGVLLQFLRNLDLSDRLISLLLASMNLLDQPNGKALLIEQLRENYPLAPSAGALADLFNTMDTATARNSILKLLESLRIELNGNRDPQEIADRLINKLKQKDQTTKITKAVEFMADLSQLRGAPHTTLKQAEQLLADYGINAQPLTELWSITDLLTQFGIGEICLDLGLHRDLQYYTGMIFEIENTQVGRLGGGGRYDDLIQTLGGKQATPATGFSLQLEAICQILTNLQTNSQQKPPVGVRELAIALNYSANPVQAFLLARELDKIGCSYLLTMGDRPQSQVRWEITAQPNGLFRIIELQNQLDKTLDLPSLINHIKNNL